MRAKRAKAYKKLMNAYGHTFGFRAPYQVLLDWDFVLDAVKHKMALASVLSKVLHGPIKPMITQCSIRHLYTLSTSAPDSTSISTSTSTSTSVTANTKSAAIELAKTFERRRCNHHTLAEPLPSFECIQSCAVSASGENKHRYVIATQDREMRAYFRGIPGVPLVYINRSVMIMEPMADCSLEKRENDELLKFSVGLTGEGRKAADAAVRMAVTTGKKRQREDGGGAGDEESQGESEQQETAEKVVVKRRKGPRQPNPLSCKKKKKALPVKFLPNPANEKATTLTTKNSIPKATVLEGEKESTGDPEVQIRRKRKRKHTSSGKKLANGGGDVGAMTIMATT